MITITDKIRDAISLGCFGCFPSSPHFTSGYKLDEAMENLHAYDKLICFSEFHSPGIGYIQNSSFFFRFDNEIYATEDFSCKFTMLHNTPAYKDSLYIPRVPGCISEGVMTVNCKLQNDAYEHKNTITYFQQRMDKLKSEYEEGIEFMKNFKPSLSITML